MKQEYAVINLDVLGILAERILSEITSASTKRGRKIAFNDMVRLIRLSRLLPAEAYIQHIGQGASVLGIAVVIVTYAYDPTETTNPGANLNIPTGAISMSGLDDILADAIRQGEAALAAKKAAKGIKKPSIQERRATASKLLGEKIQAIVVPVHRGTSRLPV